MTRTFLSTLTFSLLTLIPPAAQAKDPAPYTPERVELIPLPDNQVSFRIDGLEATRWHFDPKYPRPFFFPFNGPSGAMHAMEATFPGGPAAWAALQAQMQKYAAEKNAAKVKAGKE
jgi:hypothetical protein